MSDISLISSSFQNEKMDALITRIVEELKLPLSMDSPTPGAGNCFFAGLIQRSKRKELSLMGIYKAALSIRKSVCDFAMSDEPCVIEMRDRYNSLEIEAGRRTWEMFFENMRKTGTWAEDPAVQCAAWLLERDIIIISESCTLERPYLLLRGNRNNETELMQYPPIILGNCVGVHYQSILPVTENFRPECTKINKRTIERKRGRDEKRPSTPPPPKRRNEMSTPTHTKTRRMPKTPTVRKYTEVAMIGEKIQHDIGILVAENRKLHATIAKLKQELQKYTDEIDDNDNDMSMSDGEFASFDL